MGVTTHENATETLFVLLPVLRGVDSSECASFRSRSQARGTLEPQK